MLTSALVLSALLPLVPAETVLGVYLFHRHGDRTSKSFPPASLTDLGYQEVWQSGNFYRNRYIDANASSPIFGIASNVVKNTQLNVQAPVDTVLQNSASGFLQGLYPPVGATLGTQTLANGSSVEAPLNGFQLIPVNAVTSAASGANSENSAWLQGSSGCNNAIVSSNNYFLSTDYLAKLNSTFAFYQSILPVINGSFTAATSTAASAQGSTTDSFKNAYTIYDLVHVSMIHNTSSSIPSDNLLTDANVLQLRTLADIHEFNLAFNASEPIRAIAGSTLAAQIVQQLNTTITGRSKQPVGIQFGSYGSFFSFFGLANLTTVSENFTGIVDYASSMVFELVTNATVSNTSYPATSDISVRFLFSNGSAAANPLTVYPLFNQTQTVLPWSTFVSSMNKFAIGDQADWCSACGNTTGVCATTTSTSTSSSSSASTTATGSSSGTGGISKAVAGVIGAMVTLAVILGLEALILLLGGFRLAKKGSGAVTPESVTPVQKA